MNRPATSQGRLVARAPGGRSGAAAAGPGPYLILDLGRGCDPHQARCRWCRWRSRWRATATQAQAEYRRHQLAAHALGRGRRGRLGLAIRRRAR
jgi:hypothetical protein